MHHSVIEYHHNLVISIYHLFTLIARVQLSQQGKQFICTLLFLISVWYRLFWDACQWQSFLWCRIFRWETNHNQPLILSHFVQIGEQNSIVILALLCHNRLLLGNLILSNISSGWKSHQKNDTHTKSWHWLETLQHIAQPKGPITFIFQRDCNPIIYIKSKQLLTTNITILLQNSIF